MPRPRRRGRPTVLRDRVVLPIYLARHERGWLRYTAAREGLTMSQLARCAVLAAVRDPVRFRPEVARFKAINLSTRRKKKT